MGAESLWIPAWVALGSNQNDPATQLAAALLALDDLPDTRVQLCSPFYRSVPMGPVAQPDFINAVAGLLTRLLPQALLAHLQALKCARGGVGTRSKGGGRARWIWIF